MKALSVIGLLFVAAIIATVPISPQVTPRGLELSVDQAQAQVTYGRARRVARRSYRYARRADRRSYRYARRAGYGAAIYGSSYGYRVVAAGPGRLCKIYPSGFRWCWTRF